MKNTFIRYITAIVITILVVELTNFGFFLMNQSDSYLFYLGLLLIGSECFIGGWFFVKTLMSVFSKKEDETEKKESE
jgi:ABC-type nickel/cobalt efflux system permease component RcnA